jgi:Ca2+-binding RTX toxin-like protein
MFLGRVRVTGVWLAGARGGVVLCVVAAVLAFGASGASAASGPPVLTFSPSPYDFGSVLPGKTGAQTLTLTNTGGSPAAPVITLAGSSEFAIVAMSDMCTATVLEPGDSCTVAVRFAPTATGAVTASLQAISKKPAASATASLSGTVKFPSLAGEVFRSDSGSFLFGPGCEGIPDFSFSVSGRATGPVPGTFTESADMVLSARLGQPLTGKSFNSTFTITSGSIRVTGTNSAGPSGFSALSCSQESIDPSVSATVDAATSSNSGDDAGPATINVVLPLDENGPRIAFTETFGATLGSVPPSSSCAGRAATIMGGARGDRIVGTGGPDVIFAGAGNDRISAGKGNDVVCAGAGNDQVLGGPGNDWLFGGPGNDVINGGPGNDVIYGGPGNDRIYPGPGRDHVFAGPGNDRVFARDGQRDVIDCGPGHDVAIVDAMDVTRHCEVVIRAPRRR